MGYKVVIRYFNVADIQYLYNMKKLTGKEQGFADDIISGKSQSDAYRNNYSCGKMNNVAIASAANRIANRPHVKAYIESVNAKALGKMEITAEKVLQEIAALGFGNIKNLYDEQGELIPIHKLPDEVSKTVTEITEKVLKTQGESLVVERKYKLADKRSSLELLGRHLKLFTDKMEVDGLGDLYAAIANSASSTIKSAVKP